MLEHQRWFCNLLQILNILRFILKLIHFCVIIAMCIIERIGLFVMERYNKHDLVKMFSAEFDISMSRAKKMVDFIFDEIIQIAKNGDIITITKFGSFQIKKHKGHPTSLSRREIKDYSYLRFSPSGRLNKEIRVDLGERMQG